MTYYTGESVAEFFKLCGVGVKFLEMTRAPQLLKYHFNLINLSDYKKIGEVIQLLQLETKQTITQEPSKK